MTREDTKYRLVSRDGEIPFANYIKIDNTNLEPDVVARMIKERFELPDKTNIELQKRVSLEAVRPDELRQMHDMQVESFMPLYEKYHDEGSPAIEPFERLEAKSKQPGRRFFFIKKDGARVGAISIGPRQSFGDASVLFVSLMFVRPAYQNQGIGYVAILKAFEMFPDCREWRLDTILQEPRNCHLYEKCGFRRTGGETVINEAMTIVDYVRK